MKRLVLVLMSGAAVIAGHALAQTPAQNPAKPAAKPVAASSSKVDPQMQAQINSREWLTYAHDTFGTRYSPLTQITPANVGKLQLAWTIHTKPPADPSAAAAAPAAGRQNFGGLPRATPRFSQSEDTPLVVNGVMYINTPYRKIMAVDPTTGTPIWTYDGQTSTRGMEYWRGDKNTAPQIVFVENGGLVELDAKTGIPNPKFGNNGKVMPAPDPVVAGAAAGRRGGGGGGGSGSSPVIIYKNIIISGSANPYKDGRSGGDIRGFDAATGKQLWRFNTIPVKGEPGYDTWAAGSAEKNTGVHIWGVTTLDSARGIVYSPLNAPNWNRYGGDHVGDNLYGTSIVALDATTGKLMWHFQVVHHDIWDMDADAPSTLFDVHKDGKTIPAIGVVSKSALMFILNRVTGKPIFGVEERPVPASQVAGEHASPTQPFPVKPEPLGRQTMSPNEIAQVTPEHTKSCQDMIAKYNVEMTGKPYTPPGYKHPTVEFPGPNGSLNWGGGAFDPKLGYYIVNTQNLGQLTELGEHGSVPEVFNGVTGGNANLDENIPYEMVGLNGRFKDLNSNMMCQSPPWGLLTAVNVNTGEIAWRVPLGTTDSLPPDKQNTGRPNSGGPTITASGLVFIGATDDSRFRAFDAKTGKKLWEIKIPAGSHSVPVTYMGKNGKQYLVFPSTGGNFVEDDAADDEIMAYALP